MELGFSFNLISKLRKPSICLAIHIHDTIFNKNHYPIKKKKEENFISNQRINNKKETLDFITIRIEKKRKRVIPEQMKRERGVGFLPENEMTDRLLRRLGPSFCVRKRRGEERNSRILK